jgi:hypothetical protein
VDDPCDRGVPFATMRSPGLAASLLVGSLLVAWRAKAQVNVLTYHNDLARTGQNLNETTLTPSNVNSTTFGLIFTQQVDGYVYAQPLYLSGLVMPGKGKHNVVFVATEHDSVYAFDGDSSSGQNANPLWQVSLIPRGGSTVPSGDTGSGDLIPEIGITGTPVIDPKTGTLYVVSKTSEPRGVVQRLHALDVKTGAEKFGGPVHIAASVPGFGDGSANGVLNFDDLALHQMNRAGLLLLNGVVYVAFGSHGDVTPYHGWLIGYDAHTLQKVSVLNTTPNGLTDPSGYPIGGGAIWQAGDAPAADAQGNIYFETGNGTFDADTGGPDYGDSVIRLSTKPSLAVADYFAPHNQYSLDSTDADLGSGGVILLPDSVGSVAHPHLLVGCGKEGTIYLVDRDGMSGYSDAADNNVQTLYYSIGGTWSTPAYFNSALYYGGIYGTLKMFPISGASITTTPSSESSALFGFPDPTPAISANGNKNGVVWVLQTDDFWENGPAILRAYDASNLGTEIYNSSVVAGDAAGGAVKFAVPTIANGKVYVGAEYALNVYGLRAH